MKQLNSRLKLLIFSTCSLFFMPSAFGNEDAYFLNPKTKKTTTITYFTDYRGFHYFKETPSHEKSISPLKGYRPLIGFDYSPQRDTTKKKITQSDKGLVQQHKQQQPITEIDGLLLNSTISAAGYDFYVDFSHNWTPPANAQGYTIVVKEYMGDGCDQFIPLYINYLWLPPTI